VSLIQQKIRILKNEIQDLINNKEFKELKDEKIIELQNLTLQLKDTRKNNEYKKISRTTDSMEYTRLKNKPNSIELLTEIKDKREKAKEEFEKIKEIEDRYTTIETQLFNKTNLHIPGFIFFHKDILDNYGICPYIDVGDEGADGVAVIENRNNWINNQQDNGKLYKDIYDKLINKCKYHEHVKNSSQLDLYFENIHTNIFTDSQQNIFDESVSYLQEYKAFSIKTKKIKEKFKIIINNISILVMETGLNIHTYLYSKINVEIPINEIKTNFLKINTGVIEDYNIHLEEFVSNKENIANSIRYINNITNELKYSLSEFLYNQSLKLPDVKLIKYIGKYFKKWSVLLENEKIERLECFSEYFVQKYLVHAKLIDPSIGTTKIEELCKILIDSYKNKSLKYKYIKWNVTSGIIEKIFVLKYNDDDKNFFLDIKSTSTEGAQSEESEIQSKCAAKKPVSTKTIFNNSNEKIINEEIIVFIIKNNSKLSDINELKESFHELIKLKLKLKRINTRDKQKIYQKFDEVYNVIKNNSY
jgi:hypothetical protein